ncbi:MAG: site-specific integrase [Rhodopirellula sp.]|nr:site-specific integrase [Rhodopirellula sp.]
MASVFKLGRDKKKRHAPWYLEYKDELGKKRMKKGFTDKGLTEKLAAKLEMEAHLRTMGLIDKDAEKRVEQEQTSIEENLADFEKSLSARKATEKHIKLTVSRIRKIVNGCEFQRLSDLKADDVESFLTDLREDETSGFGFRTYNHYLQAIDSFCNWLAEPRRRRLKENPIAGIPRLNADLDVRHPRRALSEAEFSQLVSSALTSDISIQCFSGQERARIYILSFMTGLRRKEIATLTPRSFQFDAEPPTLTVEAISSKHRRKDILPLHPDLCQMAREWVAGLPPNAVLFPKLAKRRTWLMVKKDLERVGIPYRTDEGIADFHASGRHTHITQLLRNGASLPEAMKLARHSDVRTTMKYTHIGINDQARALARLPCQDIVRISRGIDGQNASSTDNESHDTTPGSGDSTPAREGVSDSVRQKKSPPVKDGDSWRRRESNPRPVIPR